MISENLHKIQQEIQDSCALVSRNANDVCLTAVTKSVDTETTRVLLENGVRDCAENRVEKLLEKKAKTKGLSRCPLAFYWQFATQKGKINYK